MMFNRNKKSKRLAVLLSFMMLFGGLNVFQAFPDTAKAAPPDDTAPIWADTATLQSAAVFSNAVRLAWDSATDDSGTVAGYVLYQSDGTTAASTTVTEATYDAVNLQPGGTYTFKVEARDAAGNESTDGPSLTVALPTTGNAFYDTFDQWADGVPADGNGWIFTTPLSDTSVEVVPLPGGGKGLRANDLNSAGTGSPTLRRNFLWPSTDGDVTIELRMEYQKASHDYNQYDLNIYGNATISRFANASVWSSGDFGVGSTTIGGYKQQANEWATYRFDIHFATQTYDFTLQADSLKNYGGTVTVGTLDETAGVFRAKGLPSRTGSTIMSDIRTILFPPGNFTGIHTIDYVAVYKTPDSVISPTAASFSKDSLSQADVNTTLTLNGNTLTAIKNGAAALAAGTDYTVAGNVVTIKKEYLVAQALGTVNLTFEFSAGAAQTLAIAVSDDPVSTLYPTQAMFDKRISNQATVATTMTLHPDDTLEVILHGADRVRYQDDYTVQNPGIGGAGTQTFTFKTSYLAAQPVGVLPLTFDFKNGPSQTFEITIVDTTVNSTIAPTVASFDKEPDTQADVTTTLTLNGNTLSRIKNGEDALTPGTDGSVSDYKVEGNTVTIFKSYLARQTAGTTVNLTFEFSEGAAQTLAIAISDSSPFSTISPAEADFDKRTSVQADITTVLTLNGNTFSGITNGDVPLTPGTDSSNGDYTYSAADNTVTIWKTYLATLPGDSALLTFHFSRGAPQTLTIAISDTTPDAAINPTSALFDKNAGAEAHEDIQITATLIENTLRDIVHGDMPLVQGEYEDYTVDGAIGETVTLKTAFLRELPTGTASLIFNFASGAPQTLTIAVIDTGLPSQSDLISPASASFDKNTESGGYADVVVVSRLNTLTDISNGVALLAKGPDYTFNCECHTITINREYLAKQPAGITRLTLLFDGGEPQTLEIAVNDTSASTPQNSMINPASASFDKKVAARTDLTTTMTLNGNTLDKIMNGVATLTPGVDYTVAADTVTVRSDYLAKQAVGTVELVFRFSGGDTQTFAIAVSDTTPEPEPDPDEPEEPAEPEEPVKPETPVNQGTQGTTVAGSATDGIGMATSTTVNNRTVTTVAVDRKKLEEKLAAASDHAVIAISIDRKSEIAIGELTGLMVQGMEQKQAVLQIQTDKASYTIPARQINIGSIAERLGNSADLQEIMVQIEIAEPDANTAKIVESAANQGQFEIVVPPLNFTVRASYGDTTVEVDTFSAYVDRLIAIPGTVDPNRVTTAVVVNRDGTVRHVPTKIVQIDGQYYAKVSSLTNSTYSLIWHPAAFADVIGHWAQAAVNDMGSRMIVSGVGDERYNPDADITRAEFAAIIVRGLGLRMEAEASGFPDVKASDWYNSAVQAALSHQLINGFEDGAFRPTDKITREQAMTIIAKAMAVTGLKTGISSSSASEQLGAFADAADISGWAKVSVAACLEAGTVSGRSSTVLAPKDTITRAEVAVIVQRLLQKSDLI